MAEVAVGQASDLVPSEMDHEVIYSHLQGPLEGTIEPATPTEVVSNGAPLQPAPAELANSQGGAHVQPAPAEVVSSQDGLPTLQPLPPASIDLTEEVQPSEENMEVVNPGTSEEPSQGSGANPTAGAARSVSMNNFISGLQRLHNMLELLRPPPADHSVGPIRTRRRMAPILRARAGESQRQDNGRYVPHTPLYAYFQVSRSQPYPLPAAHDSETRNPPSGTDSDSDGSAEDEEVVVQAEEPEANIPEQGVIATDQEATSVTGDDAVPKESPQKPNMLSAMEDEEGETCTICLEQWTNAGDHRISALRCGHLFGFRCISKWLKGQTRKCPQCNKKAKHSDIVVIYARSLRALDTSEQERMKRQRSR